VENGPVCVCVWVGGWEMGRYVETWLCQSSKALTSAGIDRNPFTDVRCAFNQPLARSYSLARVDEVDLICNR